MLNQLLKVITPELLLQAIRDNPQLITETVKKFDTFRLIGQALTTELQIVLSNNANLINEYLHTEDGKAAIKLWAEGFAEFVELTKRKAQQAKLDEEAKKAEQTRLSEIASKEQVFNTKDLEDKLRKEIREQLLKEMSITQVEDAIIKKK